MTDYTIIKSKKRGYHMETYLEIVDKKPDIDTVMYFCGSDYGFIPLIDTQQRVSHFRKGVLNSDFKNIQNNLFKEYFGIVDEINIF